MSKNPNEPTGPFHAGPGTGHEIGVMIGFMAIFVLITVAYLLAWSMGNKKDDAKERQRREDLHEQMTNPRSTKVIAVHELDKEKYQGDSATQGF